MPSAVHKERNVPINVAETLPLTGKGERKIGSEEEEDRKQELLYSSFIPRP